VCTPRNFRVFCAENGFGYFQPESPQAVNLYSRDHELRTNDANRLAESKTLTRRTTTNHLLASGVSDPFYAPHLTLRIIPVAAFLGVDPPIYPFPIASMSEDKLLIALGLSGGERKKIEGVQTKGGPPMDERGSEGQQFLRASFRLAMDPPSQVGVMQRRTTRWQLRPLYFRGDSNCGLLHVPAD
jgi:hypothetical protein